MALTGLSVSLHEGAENPLRILSHCHRCLFPATLPVVWPGCMGVAGQPTALHPSRLLVGLKALADSHPRPRSPPSLFLGSSDCSLGHSQAHWDPRQMDTEGQEVGAAWRVLLCQQSQWN